MTIDQAFILCGGFGTRLGDKTKDIPKPMLHIGGKPILIHIIEHLKKHGITSFILGTGYKSDVIEKYFNDINLGVDIKISVEDEPLGTAGPLMLAKKFLHDSFLIVFGDVFIDFDIRKFINDHEKNKPLITVLTRPSTHPWDADLFQTDERGFVKSILIGENKKRPFLNIGNASVYCASKRLLHYIPEGKFDMTRDIFPKIIAAGDKMKIHNMESYEFVRDMGTPERFEIVEKYIRDREAIKKARVDRKPIRTIFLDRDGVINRHKNLITSPKNMELILGVCKAIKILNEKGLKVIVVTNQPIIARGLATIDDIDRIHEKMKAELQKCGAFVDAIYYCPHHPETQYVDGDIKYRRGCECRKPKAGMILKAKDDFGLDIASCIMVGDSWRDIRAGKNAGLRTVFVKSGCNDIRDEKPDFIFEDLLDFAEKLDGINRI